MVLRTSSVMSLLGLVFIAMLASPGSSTGESDGVAESAVALDDDGCLDCGEGPLGYLGCGCHWSTQQFVECPEPPPDYDCTRMENCFDFDGCMGYTFAPELLQDLYGAVRAGDAQVLAEAVSSHRGIQYRSASEMVELTNCKGGVVRELLRRLSAR